MQNGWCKYIKEVAQDGRQALSDHISVMCTYVLKDLASNNSKKFTYFKMDVTLANTIEIIADIEGKWLRYQQAHRDAWVNWDLAWGRVKAILQQEKKRKTEIKRREELDDSLQRLRVVVETNFSQEVADAFYAIEQATRKQDMLKIIQL